MSGAEPYGPIPADQRELGWWFALDMDEGVIAVATTRSEVMRLAGVPKSSDRGW